ncbi:hypothetical protein ACUN9Y_19720 [Halomonas sp. V046]|uniref:hypothetical protein n=1 Tax=Halomonas sp. V046 TaxID=3459611 RepID=UPI004044DD5A
MTIVTTFLAGAVLLGIGIVLALTWISRQVERQHNREAIKKALKRATKEGSR